jgi:cytoskeletal protein CcmA (bactofilin family)
MLTRLMTVPRSETGGSERLDRTVEALKPAGERLGPANGETNRPPPIAATSGSGVRFQGPGKGSISIIGNDLTIVGQGLRIISKGTLQVDGTVEGDVAGREVIIGEKGRVCGVVCGDSVEVMGEVSGTVKGRRITLRPSARVSGDIHHQEIIVDQGAHLDGRVRRPQDAAELTPVLE